MDDEQSMTTETGPAIAIVITVTHVTLRFYDICFNNRKGVLLRQNPQTI